MGKGEKKCSRMKIDVEKGGKNCSGTKFDIGSERGNCSDTKVDLKKGCEIVPARKTTSGKQGKIISVPNIHTTIEAGKEQDTAYRFGINASKFVNWNRVLYKPFRCFFGLHSRFFLNFAIPKDM